jgi:putative ABC transport system permease protein
VDRHGVGEARSLQKSRWRRREVTASLVRILPDLARYAAKALTEKKLRRFLTILGVAIGPMALTAILGVVQGYSNYVINQLQGLGQNLIILVPGANYDMGEQDLEFLRSLSGVAEVTPFYSLRAKMKQGTRTLDVAIYAVDLDVFFKALGKLRVVEGSIPPPGDVSSAVVGYYIAYDESGRRYYSVGDVVTLTYYSFSRGRLVQHSVNVIVAGILGEFGNAFFVNPDVTVFLPLEAGPRLLGLRKWSGVILVAEDPVYVENLTKFLRDIYGERVGVISLVEISRVVASITAAMRFVTIAAGSAAFAVAATGVAATMITSVMERTREIGVLKAIGFTNSEIVAAIVLEALLMSLLGSILGISAGAVAAYALSGKGMVIQGMQRVVIKAPPEITVSMVAETVLLTMLIGVLGSLLPAYRAARIPPAEALRYE